MRDEQRSSSPSDDRDHGPSEPRTEARRVQVVARWNSWVQVYDPADDTLTWVDLAVRSRDNDHT